MNARSILALGALLAIVACQPYGPPPPHEPLPPIASPQITAQGTVLSVERPRPEDSEAFVHVVIVPQDQRPVRLALGPGWYLERQGLRFAPSDPVLAKGRSVRRNGESTLEVETIEQGGKSYVLRDGQHRPAWPATP